MQLEVALFITLESSWPDILFNYLLESTEWNRVWGLPTQKRKLLQKRGEEWCLFIGKVKEKLLNSSSFEFIILHTLLKNVSSHLQHPLTFSLMPTLISNNESSLSVWCNIDVVTFDSCCLSTWVSRNNKRECACLLRKAASSPGIIILRWIREGHLPVLLLKSVHDSYCFCCKSQICA